MPCTTPLLTVFFCIFLSFVHTPQTAFADSASKKSDVVSKLSTIERDIDWLENEISKRRKEQAHANSSTITQLESEVADLESRLERARLSFIATASEVEIPPPEDKNKSKKRDLVQEAQQLIEPLFDTVRRISEKPRRIEHYRTQIFYLQDRLSQIDRAIANLDHVITAKIYPTFESQLVESKQSLLHERDELQVQEDSLVRKLNQDLEDHRSVMQIIKAEAQDFATSKGRNFLIAVFVFGSMLWILLWVEKFVVRSKRIQSRLRHLHRPFHVLYGIGATVVSTFAVVLTLHFLNDWFLVTVIMAMLLILAWLFKSVIHLFINELIIVLNFGPVRQGERVVWQGLPWLVKTLNFRATLVNESLQGGHVNIPASMLTSIVSRITAEGEPWFPTKAGDFVALDDGIYGQIELQTPETVIVNSGSARKFYTVGNFLLKNPQNLSSGFELNAEFLARHSTPPKSLEAIRSAYQKALLVTLGPRLTGTSPDFQNLEINLCPTEPTLTRVWLKVNCRGAIAAKRDSLRRELQAAGGECWRELVEFGQFSSNS